VYITSARHPLFTAKNVTTHRLLRYWTPRERIAVINRSPKRNHAGISSQIHCSAAKLQINPEPHFLKLFFSCFMNRLIPEKCFRFFIKKCSHFFSGLKLVKSYFTSDEILALDCVEVETLFETYIVNYDKDSRRRRTLSRTIFGL